MGGSVVVLITAGVREMSCHEVDSLVVSRISQLSVSHEPLQERSFSSDVQC